MNKSPNIPDDGCSCLKILGNNVANPTVIVDVMIIGLRTVSEERAFDAAVMRTAIVIERERFDKFTGA